MRLARAAGVGAMIGALPLAACSMIPSPPEGLPEDWVPAISPSPLDEGQLDSPLGFTPEEQSAVRIRAITCEGVSTGSGFILDSHTIVTNWHVVDGYLSVDVTTADGRDIVVSSVSDSEVADIATITTDEVLEPAAPLADKDPNVADFVTIVGFPLGEEMTTTIGSVLERSPDDITTTLAHRADHVFMVSAPVKHGSSGSAAYDGDGEVFGVLYGGQGETDYGFIIPISIVKDALAALSLLAAVPECVY